MREVESWPGVAGARTFRICDARKCTRLFANALDTQKQKGRPQARVRRCGPFVAGAKADGVSELCKCARFPHKCTRRCEPRFCRCGNTWVVIKIIRAIFESIFEEFLEVSSLCLFLVNNLALPCIFPPS